MNERAPTASESIATESEPRTQMSAQGPDQVPLVRTLTGHRTGPQGAKQTDSPWLTQPGIEGHSATYMPSSSCWMLTTNFMLLFILGHVRPSRGAGVEDSLSDTREWARAGRRVE